MAQIVSEYEVCDCCAMMIANSDESGCRSYYGHQHPSCSLPVGALLSGEESEYWGHYIRTCEGCGDDILPGATVWPVIVLA